ncbi:MAG: SDR family oxidoreductase [Betaproteobacteria bacterium]
MDLGIRGRVALVTGSSSGLGAAIAERMAAEGCKTVLFARSADKLEHLADGLRARHGADVLAVAGDMTRQSDVQRLIERTVATFGDPAILILNSGRPPLRMRNVLDESDDERWRLAHETQLWAPLLMVRQVVPLMQKHRWGRVVAVTSASVKQPMPHHALSTVYRAGVTGLMRHLANEVAADGVTVNCVCPASIGTEALVSSYDPQERIKRVPMGRLGKPEEFAATVAFFASEPAGFITGASLQVDGGMVASLI